MSTSIDQAFVKQYESDVHETFQRMGTIVLKTVRYKPGVKGSSTTFQKVGKGTAAQKTRHGLVPPMNIDHTPVECPISDFYAGDWVDKLDEAKVNHNERQVILNAGAYALGRKVDDQLFTEMDTTSVTVAALSFASAAAVRNSLILLIEKLYAGDVPRGDGNAWVALTPRAWAAALCVPQFASADFVSDKPFAAAWMAKSWMGANWYMHTGLPGVGTASAKNFAYHKTAVGYASNANAGNVDGRGPIMADITWHGDHAAHFVNHMMTGGAKLIDGVGCVEMPSDDTSALPTT